MTPCAPEGAFGLSAATGSAALVAVADRWQDYMDHIGGVASHFVAADKMAFSGGFNGPSSGYVEIWSFTVSRITGKAELKVKDKPTMAYSGSKSKPQF
jgi:cytochrome bd-type quinol oxidase subunit 1